MIFQNQVKDCHSLGLIKNSPACHEAAPLLLNCKEVGLMQNFIYYDLILLLSYFQVCRLDTSRKMQFQHLVAVHTSLLLVLALTRRALH